MEQELAELAEGWEHLGDSARRAEAELALDRIRQGDDIARAGHTEFIVQGVARTSPND